MDFSDGGGIIIRHAKRRYSVHSGTTSEYLLPLTLEAASVNPIAKTALLAEISLFGKAASVIAAIPPPFSATLPATIARAFIAMVIAVYCQILVSRQGGIAAIDFAFLTIKS